MHVICIFLENQFVIHSEFAEELLKDIQGHQSRYLKRENYCNAHKNFERIYEKNHNFLSDTQN